MKYEGNSDRSDKMGKSIFIQQIPRGVTKEQIDELVTNLSFIGFERIIFSNPNITKKERIESVQDLISVDYYLTWSDGPSCMDSIAESLYIPRLSIDDVYKRVYKKVAEVYVINVFAPPAVINDPRVERSKLR